MLSDMHKAREKENHKKKGSLFGFHSAGRTNFIYQFSVEVSLVTMPPKRRIESFDETTENEVGGVDEGEVEGSGGGEAV